MLVSRSVELVANYGFGFGALLERFDSDIRANDDKTPMTMMTYARINAQKVIK